MAADGCVAEEAVDSEDYRRSRGTGILAAEKIEFFYVFCRCGNKVSKRKAFGIGLKGAPAYRGGGHPASVIYGAPV